MVNRFWNVKIWVPITLSSLLVYSLYWLFINAEQAYLDFSGRYFLNPIITVGLVLYVIGISAALLSVYSIWGPKAKSFSSIKGKVSIALFLVGLYYISFIPTQILFYTEGFLLRAASYSVYTLLNTPLLILLSLKVKLSQKDPINRNVLKWVGATSLAYVIILWASYLINWLDSVLMVGIQLIISGSNYVRFLNSVVTLSLAVFFAILGLLPVINKGTTSMSTKKWVGLSLIMLGVHFTIFLVYGALTNALNATILYDEIWMITFIGLGISLIKAET